jgi:hypothetical protein
MQGSIHPFSTLCNTLRIDGRVSFCTLQVISPIFNKLAEDEKYKDNAIFVTVRRRSVYTRHDLD